MTLAIPSEEVASLDRSDSRPSLRSRLGRAVWVAPVLAGLVVTIVYPTGFLIGLATTKSSLGKPFRDFVGLDQITGAVADPLFQASILRSISFALVSSAVELALGFFVALLFATLVKAGRYLTSFILLALMTPPVMVGVAWKLILAPAGGLLNGVLLDLGLVDAPVSFLGTASLAWVSILVADIWQWTPFIVVLSFAALMTVPVNVREAAQVDGASSWQRLVHVILPLVAGPLASIFLLKLIIAFKLFDLVYVLTFGGPGFATTTSGFAIWRLALEQFDVGRAAAETLIYAVVVGLVTLPVVAVHRRFEEDA